MSYLKVINIQNPSAGNIAMVTDILGNTAFGGNVGIGTGGGNISFNGSALVIGTQNALPIQFRTSGSQQMVITSTGNVGVGTATPLQLLHVQGGSYFTSNVGIGTSTPTTALQVNGVVTMGDASQFMTSKSFGMRNRLINGAMEIDQRRSGASYTASLGQLNYGVDRWFIYPTGATLTGQQVAGTNTGTPYAFRITGNTGSTGCNFGQRVENLNTDDLSSTQVTFRVLIYASNAITGVSLYALSPTATNNYASTTTSFSTGVTVNSGLNIITVTATLNSTANLGQEFGIAFNSGIASGVSVDISYAQAEVGSVATPFERRQYGQELVLCQRYFEMWQGNGYTSVGFGGAATTNGVDAGFVFKVTKRVAPTLTYSAVGDFMITSGNFGTPQTCTTLSILTATFDSTYLQGRCAGTPFTVGNNGVISSNNTSNAKLFFNSEL